MGSNQILGGELVWLTPTSGAKLLACPAALEHLPIGVRPQPVSSQPDNAGTLAHLAVQRWAESGDWRDDSGTVSVVDHYKREALSHGIALERLADGRMTESRLRAQEPTLTAVIRGYAGADGSVSAEEPMYDDQNHLWGTIDLLIDGELGVTVVDLKSGADAAKDAISENITNQLLHYALLVRAHRGKAPSTLAVYSLRRGLRVVESGSETIEVLLDTINSKRQAWMEGARTAVPSPEHCHFCARRLDCEPHWAVLDSWDKPDATEGVLESIRNAANGTSALLLSRDGRDVWISDVPSKIAAGLHVGAVTRVVRIWRKRRELDDLQESESWYADELSAFGNLPTNGPL